MPTYHVTWEIDLDAATPEEAARKALATQRDEESIATCFEVTGPDGHMSEYDLDESPAEDSLLHILRRPLNLRTAKRDAAGHVKGIVQVGLEDVGDTSDEQFLDLLGERLIGFPTLADIHYELLGCIGGGVHQMLLFQVEGDPTLALERLESDA